MGEKRQLAVNMIAGIISLGVQFGVSFVLTPYIVRTLGSEAYGFIPLANQIVGYTTIVTTALNSMASRFISIEMNRENTKQANIYFNSVLISNIIDVDWFLFL
ncbi:oligosaccharide flippase family protein, partial [Bifidobacterium subtile]